MLKCWFCCNVWSWFMNIHEVPEGCNPPPHLPGTGPSWDWPRLLLFEIDVWQSCQGYFMVPAAKVCHLRRSLTNALESIRSLPAWLSMHDVCSTAAKRCDGIHATTDWHSEWASLSALVFSMITWTPGQMVRAEGSGFGGRGRPCAFHLLTGSLAPLAALFSTAWTWIHTDNFTSRKVWVPACMYVCVHVHAFCR